MKISLCIICKNEEKVIARCINSVKDVVDEIILVDTGSQDSTLEIAEHLEVNIYQIPWENHFAKAKNFAIDRATGDWIIFLDADEYLTKDSIGNLRELINEAERKKKECIFCEILNQQGDKITSTFKTNRIFKHTSQIRYKGRVHERLYNTNREVMGIDFTNQIKILHDGYDEEVWKEKCKGTRNIELLLEELKEDSTNSDIYYYLMQAYNAIGQVDKAWMFGEKAIQYNKFELEDAKIATYNLLLSLCSSIKKEKNVAQNIYTKAIKIDSRYPDFDFRYGTYLYDTDRVEESIEHFKICINKVEGYNGTSLSIIQGNVTLVFELLVNAYLKQQQYELAIPILVKILRINPYRVREVYNLISILQTKETGTAIGNILGRLYDYSKLKDQLLLLQISKELGNNELYAYILQFVDDAVKEQINA